MPNGDKMSLKSFLETVAQRLNECTSKQLRAIIMEMVLQGA